jgi:cytidine deaminase
MVTEAEFELLRQAAFGARENAMSYKSGHSFGAAVLTTNGEVFPGCNTEGLISSLGVCAEMSAMDHAVVHGQYNFKALLVADETIQFPCGACLQYLTQFYQTSDIDIEIIGCDINGNKEIKHLSELLPLKFISKTFDIKLKEYKNK